ncbi:MAG: hypothetical protein LUI05_09335 [Oscillospiraceae bacterium]|nr:hypothetical protein [Oscillospiraceae bacterium]
MEAKEFLLQYMDALRRIELNRKRIESTEHIAAEVCRRNFYAYASEFQDKIYEENEELIKLKISIELAIERCPCSETEREVLYRRFILGEKWEQVAGDMLYSVQHLHRLENSALKKVKVP